MGNGQRQPVPGMSVDFDPAVLERGTIGPGGPGQPAPVQGSNLIQQMQQRQSGGWRPQQPMRGEQYMQGRGNMNMSRNQFQQQGRGSMSSGKGAGGAINQAQPNRMSRY